MSVMARNSRHDFPGSWHHVINRGLAKRPLFEGKADVRYFLSRLAREVRRGRLEVHCWCVMTTHFHLLVRSPVGELSEALRRSQNEYARFFNRQHKRDGTLVRGRFFSKPVTSHTYRRTLVRYIDRNPVMAGLVHVPWEYKWGSARSYVSGRSPLWLERSWVERAATVDSTAAFSGDAYIACFGRRFSGATASLVESRTRSSWSGVDPLDDLVGSAPPRVLAWMKRKAKLADGGDVGLPVCDALSARAALESAQASHGAWKVGSKEPRRSAWEFLAVGLLRSLASQTWAQIASSLDTSVSSSQRRYGVHCSLLEENPEYGHRAAEISSSALQRVYGVAPLPPTCVSARLLDRGGVGG